MAPLYKMTTQGLNSNSIGILSVELWYFNLVSPWANPRHSQGLSFLICKIRGLDKNDLYHPLKLSHLII